MVGYQRDNCGKVARPQAPQMKIGDAITALLKA
jgi:hypothetical protein